MVVCVNKWDLVEDKSQKVIESYTNAIRERLAPFTDFPILFISALTKQRILKVLETARDVYENRKKRIPTAKLNEIMLPIIENYPPPAWKGKYIKIKYITQLPAGQVPSFVFLPTCRNGLRNLTNAFWRIRSAITGISRGHRLIFSFARNNYQILKSCFLNRKATFLYLEQIGMCPGIFTSSKASSSPVFFCVFTLPSKALMNFFNVSAYFPEWSLRMS